jgi:hypothetical protein
MTSRARLQDDERKALVGYQPGAYVRVKISNVPCEFVRHFDPRRVHLIGGLTPQEENFGFVQVRIPNCCHPLLPRRNCLLRKQEVFLDP